MYCIHLGRATTLSNFAKKKIKETDEQLCSSATEPIFGPSFSKQAKKGHRCQPVQSLVTVTQCSGIGAVSMEMEMLHKNGNKYLCNMFLA